MATTRTVAILLGSLRKDSINRKVANALKELAPTSLKLDVVEIGSLPLYNQDLDASPPAEWVAFRNRVLSFDALLFVTPEYNRSVPGVLKNAIDVGSRPYGHSVWDGKPAGVVSVSPGAVGGFGANHHLRQSFVFLNMPAMAQPEAEETTSHGMPCFGVIKGKKFAWVSMDHHGDGKTALLVKISGIDEQQALIEADEARYYRPAYFGSDWIGVRLDLGDTDWEDVADRIQRSWRAIAPKKLTKLLDAMDDF